VSDSDGHPTETVLVYNPRSGSGDHGSLVRDRAALLGYTVVESEHETHAIDLAEAAASRGADEVVAVGGDGTLNEVVRGVARADALDSVTVGVIPAGTGNDFATNVGVSSIEEGFRVLEEGQRRDLDLGQANGRPFVNSCLAGIVAEASDETSAEMKSAFGVLAYLLSTVQLATEFTGIELSVSVVTGAVEESVWEGEAAFALVGNGRRFALSGSGQADLEDGLLDVTLVEDVGSTTLVGDRLRERLLASEGEHVTRFLASTLELTVDEDDPASFSLDGEVVDAGSMTLSTRRGVLRMPVGETYQPRPAVE
jgi:YegS/Rv2252/BmrU family lipid kinase